MTTTVASGRTRTVTSALLVGGLFFVLSWRSCQSSGASSPPSIVPVPPLRPSLSSVPALLRLAARALTCATRGAEVDPAGSAAGVLVRCPPDCARRGPSVFGTGVYAAVSSVCGAAVHSGAVGRGGGGGHVWLKRLGGRQHYEGSLANGVQSQALSRWSASFSLGAPEELSRDSATAGRPAKKAGKKMAAKKAGNKDCQMDVALVIDSSSNLGRRRFNLQKNFVAKLAAMLKVGVDGPRVGLVQTSDVPKTEFLPGNYTQPKELQLAIKELTYLGGDGNTGKAMAHAAQTQFARSAGRARVMLALVDGWPADELESAAAAARRSGVNVFLAAVAQAAPHELHAVPDRHFAKKAVCRDDGFFAYGMSSWMATTKHVKPLAQRLCALDRLVCSRTCYNSANVGFLIDGSSSVGERNFRTVLDFLAAVAGHFDISEAGAGVGAVQFTYDQRLEFGLREHAGKDGVLAALRAIPYMSGGTATGSAIAYAAQNLFRPAAPGRDFLIVVTDGQSYDDVGGPALAARNQGIGVFSVGVAWAPMGELLAMASEPKEQHVFFSRHFDGLDELADDVARAICRDFHLDD